MIGMVLGTSEGREILERTNEFTDDIFVTTATQYGGDLLNKYRYKHLNTKPLTKEGFVEKIKQFQIKIMLDSTHPYAVEVSRNIIEACDECGVYYIRYERESVGERYNGHPRVLMVEEYDGLTEVLSGINGNVFNTTGSRNISKMMSLPIDNRMIHRVLPTMKVMGDMESAGVKPEDLIMIKGPVSYDMNRVFYRDYSAACVIMKDSGLAGGTLEKIEAALDENVLVIIIKKQEMCYPNKFNDIGECIEEIQKRWKNES